MTNVLESCSRVARAAHSARICIRVRISKGNSPSIVMTTGTSLVESSACNLWQAFPGLSRSSEHPRDPRHTQVIEQFFSKETGILPLWLQSMNSPLLCCDERRPEQKKESRAVLRVAISSGRTDSDRGRLPKYWKSPKDQSNYR
jgi:hypothetical protein